MEPKLKSNQIGTKTKMELKTKKNNPLQNDTKTKLTTKQNGARNMEYEHPYCNSSISKPTITTSCLLVTDKACHGQGGSCPSSLMFIVCVREKI